jgi:RNA polymerase sigma-70 factor, ECF subfamily
MSSDAELWESFKANPPVGMAALYDLHSGLVYGLACKILEHPQEAQDVTHEVFVSLIANQAYDPDRGSLAGFLCTMARSRAIDRIRSRTRARLSVVSYVSEEEQQSPAASVEVLQDESAAAVRAALQTLPAPQREVIELAYFSGLTQTQIADRLDAPLGTVKSWARAGLAALRTALREFEGQ